MVINGNKMVAANKKNLEIFHIDVILEQSLKFTEETCIAMKDSYMYRGKKGGYIT